MLRDEAKDIADPEPHGAFERAFHAQDDPLFGGSGQRIVTKDVELDFRQRGGHDFLPRFLRRVQIDAVIHMMGNKQIGKARGIECHLGHVVIERGIAEAFECFPKRLGRTRPHLRAEADDINVEGIDGDARLQSLVIVHQIIAQLRPLRGGGSGSLLLDLPHRNEPSFGLTYDLAEGRA